MIQAWPKSQFPSIAESRPKMNVAIEAGMKRTGASSSMSA